MAESPKYKVYVNTGYIASCKNPYDALAIVAVRGTGEIRFNHGAKFTVWREGQEAQSAGDSYDAAVEIIFQREREISAKCYEEATGRKADTVFRLEGAQPN